MRPDGVARGVTLPVTGVRLSLWRAAAVFRAVTLAVCVYLVIRWQHLYAHASVADLVATAMVVVTVVVAWLAFAGLAHRATVVVADVVVTAGLTVASIAAQTAHQRHGTMPTLTTLWAAGPALEAGIVFGALGGVVAGALQLAAAIITRAGYDGRTLSSGVLILVAGGVVGYVARLIIRAEEDLRAATAERAAALERVRMSRSIHDGVLQVLGLIARDGDTPLAAEAARQEAALRALVNHPGQMPVGQVDLVGALRGLASDRVNVSATVPAVSCAGDRATEIVAAVSAALDNVVRHAGSGAHAWVLLDAADDEFRLTVRDDGVGFPPGRLEEADAAGRLGVSSSIRGRITDLGGAVNFMSSPGSGTIVEMYVPRVAT